MKIGIVSNSKICIPLLGYLSNIQAGVTLYFAKSAQSDISEHDLAGFCSTNGIAFYAENNRAELYNWQQVHQPDIIFVTGYAHKIDVLQLLGVPMGIYNIHYGSLPQYRGPAPVFWQLKNGEARLGLSIHVLTDKFDAGTVVWEQSIKNEEYHNYSYINQLFSELQVRGVAEIIAKLSQKQPLLNKEQNLTHTNYYKKPQLADVIINWGKMPAKQILDLIKACTPWNNGAGTLINGFEFKILDAQLATEDNVSQTPGTIIVLDNSFKVACLNGAILNIKYFNINNTCVPARYAGFYGLKTGQIFSSEL